MMRVIKSVSKVNPYKFNTSSFLKSNPDFKIINRRKTNLSQFLKSYNYKVTIKNMIINKLNI